MDLTDDGLNLLKRAGLNQYESRIYVSLLGNGSSTAGELAEVSNVPRSRVYDILTSLEKKGFAVVQVGRPVKYVSVPPEDAVNHLKSSLEDEHKKQLSSYDKLRMQLGKELASIQKDAPAQDPSDQVVGIIRGSTNVYTHIRQLVKQSEKRVVKITDSDGLERLEKHCGSVFKDAKKRGVKIRVVASMPTVPRISTLHKHVELRKMGDDSGRLFVKDGNEAILVTTPKDAQQDVALWVKSPALAGCMERLFNHAWEKATPLAL